MVSLWRDANPLYGEVLERHQQLAEIASRNFNFVVGKNEAQSLPLIRANERSSDEVLKREDVQLATGRFEAQARGRSFTLPARWGGRGGWFVGFRAMFHGVVVFVV